jgi:hypothetical protein
VTLVKSGVRSKLRVSWLYARWSAGKLLLLVAMLLTCVVFAAASVQVAIRAREVIVPGWLASQ